MLRGYLELLSQCQLFATTVCLYDKHGVSVLTIVISRNLPEVIASLYGMNSTHGASSYRDGIGVNAFNACLDLRV